MTYTAGEVDTGALEKLRQGLITESGNFSDYITVRELAWIAHLTTGRIYHALTYARLRPLTGIKRGPLWFIERTEALRWAHVVSQFEMSRWSRNVDRLGRMIKRGERKQAATLETGPYAQVHRHYDRPPEGLRVYTYAEACKRLDIQMSTLRQYLTQADHPLKHAARFVTSERVPVVDATTIDAYANSRAESGGRVVNQRRLRAVEVA